MSLPILEPNFEINKDCEKKSRKRTRKPQTHKIFEQKLKVQKGLEYKTKSGKVVNAKIFKEQTECNCKKKCVEKISPFRQKQIFQIFYELKNWSQKTLYLRSIVKRLPPKDDSRSVKCVTKKASYKYFLINTNGEHEEVCYKFFLNCLQISSSSTYRAIRSMTTNESAVERRGGFPTKKTKESDLSFVKKFIKRFPSFSSHYGASRSNKRYLNPNMNIKRMYREYRIVCEFKKKQILSEWKFRHVFNTCFNLAFHPKRVDTCRKCDKFKTEIQSQRTSTVKKVCLMQQRNEHWQIVRETKKTFNATKNRARDKNNNVEMFVFDLQRALELPSISTSEAFYCRQLWLYNLCVFDEKRDLAFMYIWNETIASRGAQEISSCLLKHFENYVPPETEEIILYSDACPGQNRNIKTTLMLKKCLDSWAYTALKSIEQRFFVSGHSYNSCDRCFGLIERQKKVTESIFTPDHWINLIIQAKKNEPKFTVIKMTKNDFYSSKQIESAVTNRKTTINGEKANWLNMQKIINSRTNPFEITIERYNISSPIQISLRKRDRAGQFRSSLIDYDFIPLYTECRPINRKKYEDLMKLLQYVPPEYQSFYRELRTEDEIRQKKKRTFLIDSSDDEN